jgi:hypothetical protein
MYPPLALWGEPLDFKQDIGLAMMEESKAEVRVRVWDMEHPWDEKAKLTDSIVTVGKLLSPVPLDGSDIRAVGLNYKDHAVSYCRGIQYPFSYSGMAQLMSRPK